MATEITPGIYLSVKKYFFWYVARVVDINDGGSIFEITGLNKHDVLSRLIDRPDKYLRSFPVVFPIRRMNFLKSCFLKQIKICPEKGLSMIEY